MSPTPDLDRTLTINNIPTLGQAERIASEAKNWALDGPTEPEDLPSDEEYARAAELVARLLRSARDGWISMPLVVNMLAEPSDLQASSPQATPSQEAEARRREEVERGKPAVWDRVIKLELD